MNEIAQESDQSYIRQDIIEYILLGLGLFFITFTLNYNFLLFHVIVEIFSIIIMGGIFVIGWNSRAYTRSSFFLVISVAFLFVGIIDLIHTLAYKDMNIFFEYGSNLPTQTWITARFIQAFSILLGIALINKELKPSLLLTIYTIVSIFILVLIFMGFFPDCYIEGYGLTPFKIISEYLIILILLISIIFLIKRKSDFNPKVLIFLILSIICTIVSELAFTLYVGVFDLQNVVGHYLKIAATFFVYKSIIVVSLSDPLGVLFRKLKKNEESLKLQASDLKQAYSEVDQIFNAALPLRIVNTDCIITKVNDTFCKLFQYKPDEIIGKKCYDIMPHNFCYTEGCSMEQIKQNLGKSVKYEVNLRRNDGRKLTLIINSAPYKSPTGEFLGIIQNYVDITERKKTEQRLKNLVSTVSHELRTPLTVLMMSLGLIKEKGGNLMPELQKKVMKTAERNVALLKELSEDILTLSKVDEKKISLELEQYNLLDVIKEIVTLYVSFGKEKNVSFSIRIKQDITLRGDLRRIEQIFNILVDNAIKYSKENSIIDIGAKENYKGRYNPKNLNGVLISIKDHGVGISKEDLPHIFERFFRASNVKKMSGTGLGLSIAKELIELHKGEIYVESELEKGTTFFIFLPRLE